MLSKVKKGPIPENKQLDESAFKGLQLEGLLKKKNSHGVWKDRYCLFENAYFLTYKPKGNKPSKELKENIHLKDMESLEMIAPDTLQMELKNGEILLYKGDKDKVKQWYQILFARARVATEFYKKSLETMQASGVHIAGYLMKKSHNKYQGFQERFVKLEGNVLRYYKKEADENELGNVDITTASFVRAFDSTPDCTIFEIEDGDRVFVFQGSTAKEMQHWLSTIEGVRNAALSKAQEQIKAKLIADTPARIRCYDDLGEEEFIQNILMDLEEIYPEQFENEEEMKIRDYLSCATGLVDYLKEVVPEVQRCESRPARYDVLAAVMVTVNDFLSKRLLSFLPAPGEEDQERCGLLEFANLGDIHATIDWIARYQSTLHSIRCPTANAQPPPPTQSPVQSASSSAATAAAGTVAIFSKTVTAPKHCVLFEVLPTLCRLYVYGGSSGTKGGAAAHLYDHCLRVWESVVNNVEEMLQRHANGHFYTHAPIDMWEAINQHISLATATTCPILHVMIADKVVSSLLQVFQHIIQYVRTLDTTQQYPELREIELEYLSALANDTALHIEDAIELIESFQIDEIRERIDSIFDPLTDLLVQCGDACLKRLASLVMSDVQGLLDQVFLPEWMEGNQMHVATATISDYMRDFEEYLVPFWGDKFICTILEEVILTYTRSILFKKYSTTTITTTVTEQEQIKGFFSTMLKKTREITKTISRTVPAHVLVDEESLGRLAQDVNTFNAFFSKKTGQELATEFLQIINEVSVMLFLDLAGIIQHVATRVSEYPSSAKAVFEVAVSCMKMRYEEFSKDDIEVFGNALQPVLDAAPEDARQREISHIAEGKLGLLYSDLIPKQYFLGQEQEKMTIARRLKMMSNLPILGGSRINREETDETAAAAADDDDIDEEDTNTKLLDDVMEVLHQHHTRDSQLMLEEERQRIEEEEEKIRLKQGLLSYQGYLEKKSPAHNLWQRRFYKIISKETFNIDAPYKYSFMWFKKEGGAAIKALDADKIASIAVLVTNRQLSFIASPRGPGLLLQAEAVARDDYSMAVQVLSVDNDEDSKANSDYFVFKVVQTDGKEHVLRGMKVDRVMKWINLLAQASKLAYDIHSKVWTRSAVSYYERLEVERASMSSQPIVQLVNPLINANAFSSSGKTTNNNDSKQAASPPSTPNSTSRLSLNRHSTGSTSNNNIQTSTSAVSSHDDNDDDPVHADEETSREGFSYDRKISKELITITASRQSSSSNVSNNTQPPVDDVSNEHRERDDRLKREKESLQRMLDEEDTKKSNRMFTMNRQQSSQRPISMNLSSTSEDKKEEVSISNPIARMNSSNISTAPISGEVGYSHNSTGNVSNPLRQLAALKKEREQSSTQEHDSNNIPPMSPANNSPKPELSKKPSIGLKRAKTIAARKLQAKANLAIEEETNKDDDNNNDDEDS